MVRLDSQGVRYVESVFRIRLARSGVICDGATGMELAATGVAASEGVRVARLARGDYLVGNRSQIFSLKHQHEMWYAGDLTNVARSMGSPPDEEAA